MFVRHPVHWFIVSLLLAGVVMVALPGTAASATAAPADSLRAERPSFPTTPT